MKITIEFVFVKIRKLLLINLIINLTYLIIIYKFSQSMTSSYYQGSASTMSNASGNL